jgi:F0F1-type ATP synthase gamma subunit
LLQTLAALLLIARDASSNNVSPFVNTTVVPRYNVVSTQLRVIVNVDTAVTTYVTVTSKQSLVGQYNFVVLLEVKTFTLNSNDARSFKITLCTIDSIAASISSNNIA